jgi:hypothetical protein
MIKFTLIIWVCSFLQGEVCMSPLQSPTLYNSWYECSRAAHQESLKIMSKLGYTVVNKDKIAMKYRCKEVDII